ncbi:hypothetical protein BDV23DRAFT_180813 [Aspergillus alliaceus]|uniref:Ankyrin repeat-containing domain protein n=1 Tax=Petromyces alliaceus TaxID=209559 RepID=A0A5N7CHF5_PETAA|nr:hypothetical protein BDV23DRAFT_180813 [Aspergillus alliaceus]
MSRGKDLSLECMKPYLKDWSIPNGVGDTPLHLATGQNEYVSKQLIDLAADVNFGNRNGEIPLHSLYSGTINSELLLHLAAGADLKAKDNAGKTVVPLSVLKSLPPIPRCAAQTCQPCRNGTVSGLPFVLEAGANPFHVNHDGDMPFHSLMRRGYRSKGLPLIQYIDILIAAAGPIQVRNHRGRTFMHTMCGVEPYHHARSSSQPKAIDHFPTSDIDATIETKDYKG